MNIIGTAPAFNHMLFSTKGGLDFEYAKLAKDDPNLHFGGRLGTYKYMNMDQVIAQAMKDAEVF